MCVCLILDFVEICLLNYVCSFVLNFVFQGIYMLLGLHGVHVLEVLLCVLFLIWFFAKWVCLQIILLVFQMIIVDFNQNGTDME